MKKLLAILFLTASIPAAAELYQKEVTLMCGTRAEWTMTMEKYSEHPVIAATDQEQEIIYSLWVNFETQTTSWLAQIAKTDEFCMLGVGNMIIVPPDSPLIDHIGTKIKFKQ